MEAGSSSQDGEFQNKLIISKVKNHLRTSKVQLWEAPYIKPDGSTCDEPLQALAESFSKELNLTLSDVAAAVRQLQRHSLDKLAQNKKFKSEGIATLNLKVGDKSNMSATVETKLNVTGQELMNLVKKKLGNEDSYCKLVCQGKIINPTLPLNQQNVGHNKTIFCMIVQPKNQEKVQELEKTMKSIRNTKRGAEMLANTSTATPQNYGAQIYDQSGRSLDIPDEENQALVIALTLHKRGQVFLKKQDYKSALLFLLEADDEFKKCSGTLLNMVDNYAILNLDISWCYLSLKSLDALSDVAERLGKSENFFNKSYGNNLQRLYALKGSTGEEIALFVRLYTLQGVAAYHNDQFQLAVDLLKKASGYISTLQIDDSHLTQLLELGFEPIESKQALRACNGNLQKSIEFAYSKREQREKIKKEEKEKERKYKIAKKLGKCKNGQKVNVEAYENMVNNLGFDKEVVAEALKRCNNDVTNAILDIQTNLHELQEAARKFDLKKHGQRRLSELGYDAEAVRAALSHFSEDASKAMEYLINNSGTVPSSWNELLSSASESSVKPVMNEEEMGTLLDIVDEVKEGDNYEDILSLREEREYIDHYLTLMNTIQA